MNSRFAHRFIFASVLMLAALAGVSCSTTPPRNLNDSCSIFEEKDDWYKYAHRSFKRWGVPVHVQLAIIYQESKFQHDAKPGRRKLLWVIPWTRLSSAYGYGQAQKGTWKRYKKEAGNWGADRDDFADVVDFIGWYGNESHRLLGISKWDAYRQYLAYHEGHGGYKRGTYKKKKWLEGVARKVERRAATYRAQLAKCADRLDKGWSLWPF